MGASYLFADDLISFYAFFTIIFAECAYLHARHLSDIARIAIRYYGDSFSMPEAVRSLLQSATVSIPWLTFAITVALIPGLPIYGKVLITVAYAICAPFIAYFEDNTASQNIFELACMNW